MEMLPWACVWMVCSPDLMHQMGCRAAGLDVSVLSALVPNPGPLEFLKWTSSALPWGQGGSGLPESISCSPEWIISERHDTIMAGVNLPSKEVLPQANKFF